MWPEHAAGSVDLFARLAAVDLLLTQAGKLHGTMEDELRKPVTPRLPAAGPESRRVLRNSRTHDR